MVAVAVVAVVGREYCAQIGLNAKAVGN